MSATAAHPSDWGSAATGSAGSAPRHPGGFGGRSVQLAERPPDGVTDLEVRTRTVRLSFPDPDAAFTAIAARLPFPLSRLDELRPSFDRLLSSCNDALDRVEIAGRYLLLRGSLRA